jgi:hypothetical protein
LEEKFEQNDSRKFLEGICTVKMGFQPKTKLHQDSNGNLVTGEQQVLNMWAKYLKGLLNKGGEGEVQVNTVYFGPDPFILVSLFNELDNT